MAISLARYQVMIHADFTVFRQELRAEASRMAGTDFKVRPVLDITAFRAQFRVFEAVYLRDRTFTVTPHLNNHTFLNSTNATFNQIIHNSGSAGQSSGDSFGRGFSSKWKLIIAGITATLPLLQPLLSILGSLVQGAAAVGAALPLAFAGLALSVGTLVTVFHNLNKAIKGAFSGTPTKDEKEAFDKLSDSAKKFVGQLLDIRTKLKGFQEEVQEQFFRKFTVGFQALADSPAIKILRREMGLIARDAGTAASGVAQVFASSARSGEFAALLAGIRGSFRQIASTLPSLTQMFLTLSVAAQPFVDILVGQLVGGLADLTKLVADSSKDGRLAKFFDDGLTAILAFSRLLMNVGSIFKSFFDAFTGGSDTVLGSLSALTGQLATFLKSAQGQAILGLLADKLALIGEIISNVLGPLLPLAVQLAQAISGPLGDGVRQILPALNNFIKAMVDGLSPVLKVLAPLFDDLIVVVANFVVLALRAMTTHLDTLMPVLLQFAQEMGPHLHPLIEAFGNVLLALLPLIPLFTQFLESLIPLLIQLTPVIILAVDATTGMITTFAIVITWIVTLIGWIVSLSQGFTKFGIAMDETGQFLVRVWDAIASWFTDKIVPSFMKALDDIGGFFAKLGRSIGQAVTDIRNVWDAAWAFLRDNIFNPLNNMITQTIPNAFQRGVDMIGAAWERLRAIARAPVEFFINTVVNKGIIGTFNAVAKLIPGIGEIGEVHPPGFAAGGSVRGPGGPRDDVIPAWLSNGEYIIPANVVSAYGVPFFNQLIGRSTSPRPGDGSQGLAFADGGLVGLISDAAGWVKDRINLDSIPGGGQMKKVLVGAGGKMITGLIDWAKDKVSSLFGSDVQWLGPISSDAAGILAWLRAQNGKPYGWAQAGPGSYDCSGIISAVWNLMHGANPYRHTFSTSGESLFFPKRNQVGLFTVGWANPGERGGGSVGHTAGTFAGVGVESTGSRGVRIGAGTTPVTNFAHWGTFADGGLVAKVFDRGGIWRPGELGVNTGSRNELVVPEGMKVSLSEETIGRIVHGFAAALNGGATAMLQLGRTR